MAINTTMPRQSGNSVRGRTGFSKLWGLRASVSFPPFPSPFSHFLRSPQFLHVQEAKNASNLRKALRKRLLRRLWHAVPECCELFDTIKYKTCSIQTTSTCTMTDHKSKMLLALQFTCFGLLTPPCRSILLTTFLRIFADACIKCQFGIMLIQIQNRNIVKGEEN